MAEPDAATAESLRQAGNERFAAGDLAGAEAKYSAALDAPGAGDVRAQTLGNRSLVRHKVGRFAEALEDAQASIEADELYFKAHDRKACALVSLGRLWEARKTYAEALDLFQRSAKHEALPYVRSKLKALAPQCVEDDRTRAIESAEHWAEVAKHLPRQDVRLRLATMATFWNESTPSERLTIFQQFLVVLTGNKDIAAKTNIPETNMVALPMENYKDIVTPPTWVAYYASLALPDKVELFAKFYDLCSDAEKNLIARDLKELFPRPPAPAGATTAAAAAAAASSPPPSSET